MPLQPNEVYIRGARLGYADLDEPRASTSTSEPKFSANFLLDPSDKVAKKTIKEIEAAIAFAEQETFKGKKPRYKEDRCDWVDGDECVSQQTGEVYNGYEGMKVLKARSKKEKRPDIRNRAKEPIRPGEPQFPYPGCYVEGIVRVYCINDPDKGGAGMFGQLVSVRFVGDGDPIGGSKVDVDSVYEEFEDDEDDDDL